MMPKPRDIIVRVVDVEGHCPAYRVGDAFRIVDGFRLVAEKALCMHSLSSLMPYYVALSRGGKSDRAWASARNRCGLSTVPGSVRAHGRREGGVCCIL